jgi:hypothetical protein
MIEVNSKLISNAHIMDSSPQLRLIGQLASKSLLREHIPVVTSNP